MIECHVFPIFLRGRRCNIIVSNVRASSGEKSDDSKYSFCEESEQVFDHFPKYNMNILVGDFNAKVGRENIFRQLGFNIRILMIRWKNSKLCHIKKSSC